MTERCKHRWIVGADGLAECVDCLVRRTIKDIPVKDRPEDY